MKQNKSFLDCFDREDYVEWLTGKRAEEQNELELEDMISASELGRQVTDEALEEMDFLELIELREQLDVEHNDRIWDRWLGDAEYGLTERKPVFAAGIECSYAYLGCLTTDKGLPLKWQRRGARSVEGIGGMTDVYDSFLPDGTLYKRVYLNFYSTHVPTTAPKGFRLNAVLH